MSYINLKITTSIKSYKIFSTVVHSLMWTMMTFFLPDFVFCNDCPPFCIQSLQFITGELAHISVVTHFSFEFWVQFFIQTLFRLYRGCWSFAKCCNAYNDGRRNVSYIKIACILNKHMVDAIKNMDITDHFFQQQFFSNPKKSWLAVKWSEWNS